MSPNEVKAARRALGMSQSELAQMLRLSPDNGPDRVRAWEAPTEHSRHRPISGPAIVAILALLSGWRPQRE